MRENLDEVYVSDFCDHCQWVEAFLRESDIDVEVWDCKRMLHKPGYLRAVNRKTGAVKIQEAPGVPMMFRYDTSGHALVLIGAEAILREIGGRGLWLVSEKP